MSMTQEEIEALMNDTSGISDDSSNGIDDILDGIDGIVVEENQEENNQDIDDILDSIDGVVEDEISEPKEEIIKEDSSVIEPEIKIDEEIIANKKIEAKIDEGVFPLPSSNEHKVVNQLNEVAEDTEEKASMIFDVLSFLLDENEKLNNNLNSNKEFIDSQILLLEQLYLKFPNIQVLKDNLEKAKDAKNKNEESLAFVESENMKIFEAMELMQYHDINRQKIERVMSVIKKLANYLNGIFEDDSNKSEVQIAKHISGDSSESLDENDLDNLISEFSTQD